MATMSAREFNRDVSAAKREADERPVIITDRGEPAYVLLSIDEYRRLSISGAELIAALRMNDDGLDDIDFGPVRIDLQVPDL